MNVRKIAQNAASSQRRRVGLITVRMITHYLNVFSSDRQVSRTRAWQVADCSAALNRTRIQSPNSDPVMCRQLYISPATAARQVGLPSCP